MQPAAPEMRPGMPEAPPISIVILSGAMTSQSEVIAESKDPYPLSFAATTQGIFLSGATAVLCLGICLLRAAERRNMLAHVRAVGFRARRIEPPEGRKRMYKRINEDLALQPSSSVILSAERRMPKAAKDLCTRCGWQFSLRLREFHSKSFSRRTRR
jgi:hypothetical protein